MKHTILFLAANPLGTERIALDEECAAIAQELRMTSGRDDFDFRPMLAVSVDALMRYLNDLKPTIIHFSGHGSIVAGSPNDDADRGTETERTAGIFLQKEQSPQFVTEQALGKMIASASSSTRIVVLNACFGATIAESLRHNVDCVVGMSGALDDDAARSFAVAFYRALGNRCSVGNAVDQAVATLDAKQLLTATPVLKTRDGVSADQIFLSSAERPGLVPAPRPTPSRQIRNSWLQNVRFTGRTAELDLLQRSLQDERTVALVGLGGVGKSQIAAQYCERHRARYGIVWWIACEEVSAIGPGLMQLARELGIDERLQMDTLAALRIALAQRDDWLLVFDDIADPAEVFRLMPAASGHRILTSRNQEIGDLARTIPIDIFEPAESAMYLEHRLGTAAGAPELAAALGHLPLALAQAAAHARAFGGSAADYLALFRERRRDMWKTERPPTGYPDAVSTTWQLSIERAIEEEPASLHLASLTSFFGADGIPFDLLASKTVPELADPLRFRNAVAALHRLSLAEAANDALSIHCLVQAVVRDRLGNDAGIWAGRAARIALSAWPKDMPSSRWQRCGQLLSHALAAARHIRRLEIGDNDRVTLLNQIALYLIARGDPAQAIRITNEVLGDTEYGQT